MTLKVDEHGLTVQAARPCTSQTIAFTAASAMSTLFANGPTDSYDSSGAPIMIPNNTTHVRCVCTAPCWIAFGPAPIAAVGGNTSMYLPAGVPEYFWVWPNDRIAVIQDTGGGSLNIVELQQ